MSERAALPLRLHTVLLGLAGRVDDSALSQARRLAARARTDEAAELITGTLVAGQIPVRRAEQHELAALLAASGADDWFAEQLIVDDSLDGVEHRFSGGAAAAGVSEALAPVLRRLPDVRAVHAVWRNTVAGRVPGPMPQRLVLAQVGTSASALATAYRMDAALHRAGISAAVEVTDPQTPPSDYHAQALAAAEPVTTEVANDAFATREVANASFATRQPAPEPSPEPEPTPATATPEPDPAPEPERARLAAARAPEREPSAVEPPRAAEPTPRAVQPEPEPEPAAAEREPESAREPAPVLSAPKPPPPPQPPAPPVREPEPEPEPQAAQPEPEQEPEPQPEPEPERPAQQPATTAFAKQPWEPTELEPGELFWPQSEPPAQPSLPQPPPPQQPTAQQPTVQQPAVQQQSAPETRVETTTDLSSSELGQLRSALAAGKQPGGTKLGAVEATQVTEPAEPTRITGAADSTQITSAAEPTHVTEPAEPEREPGREPVEFPTSDMDNPRLSDRDRELLRELHAELAKREREQAAQVRLNGWEPPRGA